jgi:hypothetical protein
MLFMLRFFYLFVCGALCCVAAVSAQEQDTLRYLLPEVDAVDASLPSAAPKPNHK